MSVSGEFLRPRYPRRRRRRRRSLRALGRVLRVSILVAPGLAAAAWLLAGSTFRLHNIESRSTARIPTSWVRQTLDRERGSNLFLLSLAEVRESLSGHPWLAQVDVRKALPDTLHVLVEERQAAAVLETAGEGAWFVDREGRRIAPVGSDDRTAGLLTLAAGSLGGEVSPALQLQETECLRRAIAIADALATVQAPVGADRLVRIEVVGDDDFRLFAEGMPFAVLVRSTAVRDRARLLVSLLPEIRHHRDVVGEVDLRFAGRVVVRQQSTGDPAPKPKET